MKCALISGTYFFIQLGSLNRNKGTKQSIAVQKATSSWGADVRLKQGANMVTTSSSFGQTVGNLTTYIHACMHACIHTYIHTSVDMFYLIGVLWQWPLTHIPTPTSPPPSLRDWQRHLKDMFWNWTRICEVTAIKKNILYYYNLQVSIAQTVIINI